MTARVTESRTDGNEPNGEASVCRLLQTFPLGSFPSVLLSSFPSVLLSSVLLSSYFLRLSYFLPTFFCPTFFYFLPGRGSTALGVFHLRVRGLKPLLGTVWSRRLGLRVIRADGAV
jgi:hypothetical protein